MQEGKWYFDDEDSTVSVIKDGESLEVCTVCTFDQDGSHWIFGEKTKAHAALLTSAPALLQALEDMHNQECGRYELKSCGHNYVCVCVGDKAKAAIAAARGTV